jgi:electron transfer flavoprotein alpha subunit
VSENKILAILFADDDLLKKNDLALIGAAKKASALINERYDILAIGLSFDNLETTLLNLGAEKVFTAKYNDKLNIVNETVTPLLTNLANKNKYKVIMASSSVFFKDLLASLGALTNRAVIFDVVEMEFINNEFIYTRPIYAGNIFTKIKSVGHPDIVTVRTTEFLPIEYCETGGEIINIDIPLPLPGYDRLQFTNFIKTESERPLLVDAKVVVAGGRGAKSKEGFTIIENLADALGGAVGGSRAAVDNGFIENDFQIGQTGKIVAPDLYIAAGISGALQHTAGIKSAKCIVAINKDPDAPIFNVADYGIVGDLFEVVPELTDLIKE